MTVLAAALALGQKPGPPAPKATAASTPSYRDLKFPPLGAPRVPEVATYTLANGIRLYLLENHELPLVSGFALVRTGNLFEPADKVGLAEITGEVMRSGGTREKTGDQVDEQLENVAASVESGIGETSGSVSFSTLKEHADEVLTVFRDVLTTPEFRQDKIDLVRNQLRGAIARRNDEPDSIAAREFASMVYGPGTPYGRRLEYEHVERITRDDLAAFHRRYFFPANVMLVVQGDFNLAQMKARLEKLFAGWSHQQPPVPAFPAVTHAAKPGLYLAGKNDVNQTFFALGHAGGLLNDKDYPALEVLSDILGGGFASRLFKRVRTELGYAYSVGGGWGAEFKHPGLFQISGSTKSASTTAALEAIRAEIDRLRASEVTGQELDAARQTVLNSFVFRFDRPSKTLNRLATYEYYGYPKDFLFRHQKAVSAVTKADILRVARERLKPESLIIVAVGKPADFGRPIADLKLSITPIDLTIPKPRRAEAASDTSEKGRALLARVQQALGGSDKLAAIVDYVQSAEADLSAGPATMKARQRNRWLAPSFYRQEQELPFGRLTAFSDGKTGWLSGIQGVQPMAGPVLKQVQTELFRSIFRLLLSDRDPSRTVAAVGENTLSVSDQTGNVVRLEIDRESGLPVRQWYALGPSEIVETWSAWKEVDGLRLPHKISLEQAGRKAGEITILEWKLNTGLKAEEMSRTP